ncbi:uncharacterized protein LOC119367948 [Triticum dicoccoides]|uniref:uncharacterized protein LOC119367948 n=1 Tax=Triticum dicoccoides TaxID=85692 RepID=UPI00188E362C|nr:uncharacterized protein LOC119367948 [Triticum dicoccoides]
MRPQALLPAMADGRPTMSVSTMGAADSAHPHLWCFNRQGNPLQSMGIFATTGIEAFWNQSLSLAMADVAACWNHAMFLLQPAKGEATTGTTGSWNQLRRHATICWNRHSEELQPAIRGATTNSGGEKKGEFFEDGREPNCEATANELKMLQYNAQACDILFNGLCPEEFNKLSRLENAKEIWESFG